MTADELAIFQAAVEIYIARETRLHGRNDSDLRFEAAEKARLRFQAADEANALYQHVCHMQVAPYHSQEFSEMTVIDVLDKHKGNVATAAIELGCGRRAVYNRVRKIAPNYFKTRARPRRYDIPVTINIKCEEVPA